MYVVFDIGGTNLRIAWSTDRKQLVKELTFATPETLQEATDILDGVVKKIMLDDPIEGIAGGIAGVLDKGIGIRLPNLPKWEKLPIKQTLSSALGMPVILKNDALLGGTGEAVFGAGRDRSVVGYVTIGTGIGGIKIVDGAADTNTAGCEPGQMVLQIDPEIARWEELAGGKAIEKKYGKKAEEITDTEFWEKEAQIVAAGLINCCVLWSPEIIILGGSVTKSIPMDKVRSRIQEVGLPFAQIPEIAVAKLGSASGLYGALEILRRQQGYA